MAEPNEPGAWVVFRKTASRRDSLEEVREANLIEDEEIAQAEKRRRAKLRAAGDYIGFVVSKVIGACLCFAGLIEILSPSLLGLEASIPGTYLGIGSALLIGKPIMKLVHRFAASVEEVDAR